MFLMCLLLGSMTLGHAQKNDASDAFDFWVGEWEVFWYGQDSIRVTGSNRIEKILDGKVMQEHFRDPASGFQGTSISVYDPKKDRWEQAWADNSGSFLHFVGVTDNGQRIFTMTEEDERGVLYRMVFTDIGPDSLTWTWEGTRDQGASWKTAWQIFYRRKH